MRISSLGLNVGTAQKMKFFIKVFFPVNVTKSCRFGHIYWRILNGKFHFLCSGSNFQMTWRRLKCQSVVQSFAIVATHTFHIIAQLSLTDIWIIFGNNSNGHQYFIFQTADSTAKCKERYYKLRQNYKRQHAMQNIRQFTNGLSRPLTRQRCVHFFNKVS